MMRIVHGCKILKTGCQIDCQVLGRREQVIWEGHASAGRSPLCSDLCASLHNPRAVPEYYMT